MEKWLQCCQPAQRWWAVSLEVCDLSRDPRWLSTLPVVCLAVAYSSQGESLLLWPCVPSTSVAMATFFMNSLRKQVAVERGFEIHRTTYLIYLCVVGFLLSRNTKQSPYFHETLSILRGPFTCLFSITPCHQSSNFITSRSNETYES